jgi:hypothetical protein
MLAHQGGWDEMLYMGGAVVVLSVYLSVRHRRPPDEQGPPTSPHDCRYCGRGIPLGETRCPACGFKDA